MDDMLDPSAPDQPRRRRPALRWSLWLLGVALILCAALWTAYLSVTGRTLSAPDWVVEAAETRINAALDGPRITLADIELTVRRSGLPRLRLRDVGVLDAGGQEIARLNELGARLDRSALWSRDIRPRSLTLSGAQITLRRRADGTFDLSLGDGLQASGTLAGVLDRVDAAMSVPPLDLIERVEADEVTIVLEDARSRRVWQVTSGQLTLEQSDQGLDLNIAAEVFNGTEDLASLSLGLRTDRQGSGASLTARFSDARAADIAAQAPVLSFIQVIDAPISGALRTTLARDGTLDSLSGTLEAGAGALRATEGAAPIGFAGGQVYFDYDPARRRLELNDLSVESDLLLARATGHAYLRDLRQGVPQTLLGQISLSRVEVQPGSIFETHLFFNDGAADFRLRLDPFTLEVGQAVLIDEELRISGTGLVSATQDGWSLDVDLAVPEAAPRRILAFWPVDFANRTRQYLYQNITGGTIKDAAAALRLRPGRELRVLTTFDFTDAEVRFLDGMPPIQSGAGYAQVTDRRFSLFVEGGVIRPPKGGEVVVTGSSIVVPDTEKSPADMQVRLRTESSIDAALSLIDQEPLRLMSRADRRTDLAQGRAALETVLRFALKRNLTLADVEFRSTGLLSDLRSDTLVPGRDLTADTLTLDADASEISVAGDFRLDGVPVTASWRQPVGPNDAAGSVDGTVALSAATLEAFDLTLPEGTVTGAGQGQFQLDLGDGAAPRLSLVSDLNRIGLAIPALGWSLPANTTGRLALEAQLGPEPSIDTLVLDAPGLTARGRVSIAEGGGLGAADFERVRAGAWFDAPVSIVGRGADLPPEIRLQGGTVDLRALPDEGLAQGSGGATGQTGSGQGSAAAESSPIRVALDRLVVSDGITLTALNGNFSTARGIEGSFGARVNGTVPIAGRVVPERGRSAIQLTSDDGGGVMAAAGVIPNFRGGQLELTLRPGAGEGVYDGRLLVRGTRIVEAPAMTELLSAVSVVGLIDQMAGAGIGMDLVDADFTLTPTEVRLRRSSATGPSLGITLDGVYRLGSGAMRMQGVVSPVYFLNSIGQIFSRPGEGLFGFNYTLTSDGQDTQVGVNPLSILTPGLFREIFRRPPPS